MDITQSFYDDMATQYEKLFLDWLSTTREQAIILDRIFKDNGFDRKAHVLDCACGIGTQSIGLAAIGYQVSASDISDGELAEARDRAKNNGVQINFEHADFRHLSDVFPEQFDIVIAMDNALPHMLTKTDLEAAIKSILGQTKDGGIFAPHLISTRRKKASGCLFRRGSGMMIDIILFNTSLTTRNPFKSGSSNAITEPSARMNSHTSFSPMAVARSLGSRQKLPASINQS